MRLMKDSYISGNVILKRHFQAKDLAVAAALAAVFPGRLAAAHRWQTLSALPMGCDCAGASCGSWQPESADTPPGFVSQVRLYPAAQMEASREGAGDLQTDTPAEQGFQDVSLDLNAGSTQDYGH